MKYVSLTNFLFFFIASMLFSSHAVSQQVDLTLLQWEMEWNSNNVNGKRPSKVNKNFKGDGISINNVKYKKGIGTQSFSRITYELRGKYTRFDVLAGLDDGTENKGSVMFLVIGDHSELFRSGVVTAGSAPLNISLDVSDVYNLTLIVHPTDDGTDDDFANWVNPTLLQKPFVQRDWQLVSNIKLVSSDKNNYIFSDDKTVINVSFLKNRAIRINTSRAKDLNVINTAIQENITNQTLVNDIHLRGNTQLSKYDDYYLIRHPKLALRIYINPFKVALYDAKNENIIVEQLSNQFDKKGSAKNAQFILPNDPTSYGVYGAGLQYSHFNLAGKSIRNWSKYVNKKRQSGEVEVTIPLLYSTLGYGVLLLNNFDSVFHIGSRSTELLEVEVSEGNLDFVIMTGNLKSQVKTYFELTGYPALLPKYAFGHAFRGYGAGGNYGEKTWTASQYISYFEEFKNKGLLVDIVGTESGWSSLWGNLIWDETRFPAPEKWLSELRSKGHEVNHLFRTNLRSENPEYDSLEPFLNETGYPDVTSHEAMDTLFDFVNEHHYSIGTAGFKEDSHVDPITYKDTWASGAQGKDLHNAYWLLWIKAMTERFESKYDTRAFNYLASGYTGSQRFPYCNYSDFAETSGVSNAVANSGWFGINYSPDIEGFYLPTQAAYVRALQFTSLTTCSTQNEWAGGELPWQRAEKTFNIYKAFNQLHYKLFPYFYSYYGMAEKNGLGLIRPLPLAYEIDTATHEIGNQYLLGKELLIAPITDSSDISTQVDVYLPKGDTWIEWFDNTLHEGGTTYTKDYSLTEYPIFIRAGAIIPMLKHPKILGTMTNHHYEIHVFPGRPNEFVVYEDDGKSLRYKQGDIATFKVQSARDVDGTFVNLYQREGFYQAMPTTVLVDVKIHGISEGIVTLNDTPAESTLHNNIITLTDLDIAKGNYLIKVVPPPIKQIKEIEKEHKIDGENKAIK